MKLDGKVVYDERQLPLALLYDYGSFIRVRRLCACSIGDYFAILTWLVDKGFDVK
jgi:hypothetical protein